MKFRQEVCVVVDAYSTGSTLSGIFAGYGYPSIHIQSNKYIPNLLKKSFRKEDFLKNFLFNGDLNALYAELELGRYNVKFVVPGAECGVELADMLSEKLMVLTNGTEYSNARRNKFVMHETLKKEGVRSVLHYKSNSLDRIIQWAREYVLPNPVVLKPLASSSTDGFHICRDEAEIKLAFNEILLSNDIFGNINEEVLIQGYLDGQEYCVNMVSYNGNHYLSEIWQTNKRINKYSKIYDSEYLVTEYDKEFKILTDYVKTVLDALRIKFGPSHSEVIITQKDGLPTLVESAARLMGSIDLSLITEALSTNAAMLTAEAYLVPNLFMQRFNRPLPPAKKLPCMVQLISTQSGRLLNFNLDQLRKLKTFHGVDVYIDLGADVSVTVDTRTSPGLVFLMGDTIEDLRQDYLTIRNMEQEGKIYTIGPKLIAPLLGNYPISDTPIFFNSQKPTESYGQPTFEKKNTDPLNFSLDL